MKFLVLFSLLFSSVASLAKDGCYLGAVTGAAIPGFCLFNTQQITGKEVAVVFFAPNSTKVKSVSLYSI